MSFLLGAKGRDGILLMEGLEVIGDSGEWEFIARVESFERTSSPGTSESCGDVGW